MLKNFWRIYFMRFREQQEIIEHTLPYLKSVLIDAIDTDHTPRQLNVPSTSNEFDQKMNMLQSAFDLLMDDNSDFLKYFERLQELPFSQNSYLEIKDFFYSEKLSSSDLTSFRKNLGKLVLKLEAVAESINLSLPNATVSGISVKTPAFDSFSDSVSFFQLLEKSFILIYSNDGLENKEIKFSNFDSGSNWVDIVVPAFTGISLLNVAIKSAFFFLQKKQENEITKTNIEASHEILKTSRTEEKSKQMLEEYKQHLIEVLDEKLKADTTNNFKKDLEKSEEHFDTSEEYLNQALKGIENLSKLMEKGTYFEKTPHKLNTTKTPEPELMSIAKQQKEISKLLSIDSSKQEQISSKENDEG